MNKYTEILEVLLAVCNCHLYKCCLPPAGVPAAKWLVNLPNLGIFTQFIFHI